MNPLEILYVLLTTVGISFVFMLAVVLAGGAIGMIVYMMCEQPWKNKKREK